MPRLEVSEIVAGIWSLRRGSGSSAAYLVQTFPGALLVDTGPDPTGADVMWALQRARVGLRSIRAILLTHSHPHGAAGGRALRERTGAPLLCSREEDLTGIAEPDGFLCEGDAVENRLEVVDCSGHTPGHLAFRLRGEASALFCGDAASTERGEPRLAPGPASPDRAGESLRKCLGMELDLLLPAHGPPLSLGRRR